VLSLILHAARYLNLQYLKESQARPARELVLVGGGHSHALVLLDLARAPLEGARVTLVSDTTHALYSGMLPGCIAGLYRWEELQIDLQRLCRAAGVRFVHAPATGIDRAARTVRLAGGAPLRYDLLSLNIGAVPRKDVPDAEDHAVAAKPFVPFRRRWTALLARCVEQGRPVTVAVVGAGAAGVELALAIQHRLDTELRARGARGEAVRMHLVGAADTLLDGHAAGVRQRFASILRARGIALHLGERVTALEHGELRTASGLAIRADEIVWATGAGAAGWLRATGLALDDQGFVQVHATLRSVNDPAVFAAGDVASLAGQRIRKAGAVAVYQAPVLAANLRRALRGEPLLAWRAKPHWLALIGTGERHAVASRGSFSAEGRWVWWWKDWLDRRFMRRFGAGA
jgi:selenide,water dikinase